MTNKFWLCGLVALICFAQGGPVNAGQPTQNVNVVNTPTVNVGSLAISTVKVFQETGEGISDVIDVSAFKQIRIVARCSSPAGPMTVRPFTMYGNTIFEVATLGDLNVSCNSGSTTTYDTPGQKLIIQVIGSGTVVVYGRAN
jgi:hypothetical protein